MSDALPRSLPELLVSLERPGEYLVSNPLVRTYALGDEAFVRLLSALRAPPAELGELASASFRAVDATASPFRDGLLGDPTGVDRDATLEGAEPLDLDGALALARKLMLAVDDEEAYASYFGPRKNVLDRGRRGNLHQRVGEHVMLELREQPDEWWVDQKFTPDRRDPRPGLYRDVQMRFMERYYGEGRLDGKRVLDFGCGPGLFARLFARGGATVVGLDTNESHLETARRLTEEDGLAERASYHVLQLPLERGLAALDGERFDLIFLSDVMMFYFHPYGTDAELDPVELLTGLRGLLAPDGVIAVLEPNGTFWQQPWLGPPERPFTIVGEYRHRRYGVTPTLEQLSRAAEHSGLAIAKVRELVPGGAGAEAGRGLRFAAEFPIWWFFELRLESAR